jgi:hypothetical protein
MPGTCLFLFFINRRPCGWVGTCLFLFFINRRPCGWVLFVKECARHVKFIVEILVLSRQYQFANPADYTTECLLYSSFL